MKRYKAVYLKTYDKNSSVEKPSYTETCTIVEVGSEDDKDIPSDAVQILLKEGITERDFSSLELHMTFLYYNRVIELRDRLTLINANCKTMDMVKEYDYLDYSIFSKIADNCRKCKSKMECILKIKNL